LNAAVVLAVALAAYVAVQVLRRHQQNLRESLLDDFGNWAAAASYRKRVADERAKQWQREWELAAPEREAAHQRWLASVTDLAAKRSAVIAQMARDRRAPMSLYERPNTSAVPRVADPASGYEYEARGRKEQQ
jgi:uncharacterized membrane protein YccC